MLTQFIRIVDFMAMKKLSVIQTIIQTVVMYKTVVKFFYIINVLILYHMISSLNLSVLKIWENSKVSVVIVMIRIGVTLKRNLTKVNLSRIAYNTLNLINDFLLECSSIAYMGYHSAPIDENQIGKKFFLHTAKSFPYSQVSGSREEL